MQEEGGARGRRCKRKEAQEHKRKESMKGVGEDRKENDGMTRQ